MLKNMMTRVSANFALGEAAHLADRGALAAAKQGFPGPASDQEISRCQKLLASDASEAAIIDDLIAGRQYQTAEAVLAEADNDGAIDAE